MKTLVFFLVLPQLDNENFPITIFGMMIKTMDYEREKINELS